MKDLDEHIKSSSALRPRRELSGNFTASIVSELKAQPTARHKESRVMKLIHSPVFAVAVAAILLVGGGTAYAATDGFTKPFDLKNIFGYKSIEEKDGQKVLAIQTANCTVGSVNASADSAEQTLYFRLKGGSTGTPEVLRWLQGYCETIGNQKLFDEMRRTFGLTNQSGGTIQSVDGNIITASWQLGEDTDTQTFTDRYRIDGDTKVVKGIGAGDTFKVGDYVSVVTAEGEYAPNEVQPAHYILHTSSASAFYTANSYKYRAQLERVQPCEDGSFCAYGSAPAFDDDLSKEAVAFVKQAYEPYKTAINDDGVEWNIRYQAAQKAFAANITPQLKANLNSGGGDPILCTQSVVPDTMTYGTPTIQGATVIVPVLRPTHVGYTDSGESMMQDKVFADVSYSATLKKITSIDCTYALSE